MRFRFPLLLLLFSTPLFAGEVGSCRFYEDRTVSCEGISPSFPNPSEVILSNPSKNIFESYRSAYGFSSVPSGGPVLLSSEISRPSSLPRSPSLSSSPSAPSSQTGLFSQIRPSIELFAVAMAFLLFLGFSFLLAMDFVRPLAKISSFREGDSVSISVSSRKALYNLELLVLISDPPFSASPGCVKGETVLGTSLKWLRPALIPGEKWIVSYRGKPAEKGAVQLRAVSPSGSSLSFSA